MSANLDELKNTIETSIQKFNAVREEIAQVIVGQEEMVDYLLIALLADGHVLLEGLPGLAKTLAVTTLAKVIDCEYKRIQFTPDLLPADLIGTSIYNPKEGTFSVSKGPIFTNILLADEINRAPAKVQSALLEVMQERHVTISGQTFDVAKPYLVLATQNPIEQEGTYPLPEAQTDRFMFKVKIDYPTLDNEKTILEKMATLAGKPTVRSIISGKDILDARAVVNKVYIDEKVSDYILNIVFATRYPKKYGLDLEHYILTGASPRASIALYIAAKAKAYLEGRAYVVPEDVKSIAHATLRHRIRRSYEAEAEEITTDDLINRILNQLPVP